jgi:hypothetical protein
MHFANDAIVPNDDAPNRFTMHDDRPHVPMFIFHDDHPMVAFVPDFAGHGRDGKQTKSENHGQS